MQLAEPNCFTKLASSETLSSRKHDEREHDHIHRILTTLSSSSRHLSFLFPYIRRTLTSRLNSCHVDSFFLFSLPVRHFRGTTWRHHPRDVMGRFFSPTFHISIIPRWPLPPTFIAPQYMSSSPPSTYLKHIWLKMSKNNEIRVIFSYMLFIFFTVVILYSISLNKRSVYTCISSQTCSFSHHPYFHLRCLQFCMSSGDSVTTRHC